MRVLTDDVDIYLVHLGNINRRNKLVTLKSCLIKLSVEKTGSCWHVSNMSCRAKERLCECNSYSYMGIETFRSVSCTLKDKDTSKLCMFSPWTTRLLHGDQQQWKNKRKQNKTKEDGKGNTQQADCRYHRNRQAISQLSKFNFLCVFFL